MKVQSFASVAGDIRKGKLAPVYFLYGEESYPIDRLIGLIKDNAIDPATRDFNYDLFQGEAVDGDLVVSSARSFPMMTERRLVILKSAQRLSANDHKQLLAYVESPLDSTCLVICATRADRRKKFWGDLCKKSVWLESKPLYENQAQDWVDKKFKSQGVNHSMAAAQMMVQLVGTSMWHLHFEIEKVMTFCVGKTTITREDVLAVVGLSRDYNLWEFTDSVAHRDMAKAIQILNYLMDTKSSPVGLVMDLTKRMLLLIRIRLLLDQGMPQLQIERALGLRPYFAKLYIAQCRRYSLQALQASIKTLLAADQAFKTGAMDAKTGITLVVHDILSEKTTRFF